MSLARRLARWQEAGLIDQATTDRILAFEVERKRPVLLYAFGGLGALAVAIGILSVIAANWDDIGRPAKLGADLLLLGAIAYGVHRSRPAHWLREVFLILYFLLILASIALVGQTYQLGGEPYQALGLWLVLGTPLVFFGRSWLLAALWLAAFIAAAVLAVDHAFDTYQWLSDERVQVGMVVTALSLGPPLCFLLGLPRAVARWRPQYAGFFHAIGWIWLIGLTSLAQHGWYLDTRSHYSTVIPPWSLIVPVLAGLAMCWYLPKARPEATVGARQMLQVVLLFATFSSLLPLAFKHHEISVLGALSFILLWIGLALAAYQMGFIRLLNLATAVLALRLVVGYIELFGSLLETGLGMIIGGLLTLALAWLWVRKSRDFRKNDAQKRGGGP